MLKRNMNRRQLDGKKLFVESTRRCGWNVGGWDLMLENGMEVHPEGRAELTGQQVQLVLEYFAEEGYLALSILPPDEGGSLRFRLYFGDRLPDVLETITHDQDKLCTKEYVETIKRLLAICDLLLLEMDEQNLVKLSADDERIEVKSEKRFRTDEAGTREKSGGEDGRPHSTDPDAVRKFRSLLDGLSIESQRLRQAVASHLDGRWTEAEAAYREVLSRHPNEPYSLNNLGHLLLQRDRVDEALKLFKLALAADPTYALAYNNLGNAYLKLGQVDEALAAYQRAAECSPAYAMPHRNLALIHHVQGRNKEAVAEYREYFSLAPDAGDAEAHFNLGVILEQLGQAKEAELEYHKAVELDPGFAKAHNNLGLLSFARGEVVQARERYQKALEADPNFTLARFNLGVALAAEGDYETAIQRFGEVCSQDPANSQAASNQAVLYTNTGRFQKAIGILEKLVIQHPANPTFHFNLATAYQGRGWKKKAGEAFRKVIELEAGDTPRARRARLELDNLQAGERREP